MIPESTHNACQTFRGRRRLTAYVCQDERQSLSDGSRRRAMHSQSRSPSTHSRAGACLLVGRPVGRAELLSGRIYDTERGPRTAAPYATAPAWLAGWHAVVGPFLLRCLTISCVPCLANILPSRACFSNGLNLADGWAPRELARVPKAHALSSSSGSTPMFERCRAHDRWLGGGRATLSPKRLTRTHVRARARRVMRRTRVRSV